MENFNMYKKLEHVCSDKNLIVDEIIKFFAMLTFLEVCNTNVTQTGVEHLTNLTYVHGAKKNKNLNLFCY
jgi:hypothetical protein